MKNLRETKTHVAIKHILKRLKPAALYKTMADIIEWQKSNQFDGMNFNRFVRGVAKKADRIDEDGVLLGSTSKTPTVVELPCNPKAGFVGNKNHRGHNKRQSSGNGAAQSIMVAGSSPAGRKTVRKRGSTTDKLPPSLNDKGDRKNFISDCRITSSELCQKLLQEYHMKKNKNRGTDDRPTKKPNGSVKLLSGKQSANTSLFSASFGSCAVKVIVLAD